jgi:AcrR family transcriptional regulator
LSTAENEPWFVYRARGYDGGVQKRAEQTRAKLLHAGAELIARDGYHHTSSKKIARAAGVAIGSFYNHFPDKKALLVAAFSEHVQGVHETVSQTLEREGFARGDVEGRRLIAGIVEQAMALHHYAPAFHRQMTALRYTDDDIAALLAQENQRVIATLTELLAANPEPLRVSDLGAAAQVVVTTVEAVVHEILFDESGEDERRRRLDALADMLHRYLYA